MQEIYFDFLLEHLRGGAIPIEDPQLGSPRRVDNGSPSLPNESPSPRASHHHHPLFLPNACERNKDNQSNQGRIQRLATPERPTQLQRAVQRKKSKRPRQRPHQRTNVLHPDIGVVRVQPSNKKSQVCNERIMLRIMLGPTHVPRLSYREKEE